MAEPYEAGHSTVNVLNGVYELFSTYPFPGKDLVWLVDEIVQLVQHTGSVHFEFIRDEAGQPCGLVCRSPESPAAECRLPVSRLGVFRSMLARLAVMCSDETGAEFQPYGGRYSLARSSRDGPIRLDIEFINTTASQTLTITRSPVSRTGYGQHFNGTPASQASPAPAST